MSHHFSSGLAENECPLVRLSCYEPAGREVVWTETDLRQHTLILGATGSGKTSQLRRVLHQLISYRANDPDERIGVCILDAKGDDTLPHVKAMASAAGRLRDVVVVGPSGDHSLELFGSLRSLADVERVTRRVLLGSAGMGSENAFWDEYRCTVVDAENLATVRSKRAFFIAVAQGLSGLDEQLGQRVRQTLLHIFGSLLLFRTREHEVQDMAASHFGATSRPVRSRSNSETGNVLDWRPMGNVLWEQAPVCPPGALGRLVSHQAFVSLPETGPSREPVWFVPAHEDPALPVPQMAQAEPNPNAGELEETQRVIRELVNSGARLIVPPEVLEAVLQYYIDPAKRERAVVQVRECFPSLLATGLESVPTPWLQALPGIARHLMRQGEHDFRGRPQFRRLFGGARSP